MEITEFRTCGRCKESKPTAEFYESARGDRKYRTQCKTCDKLLARLWQTSEEGKRKVRSAHLKRRYGITLDEYEALLKEQDNKCLICCTSFDKVKPDLDHCHTSKKVRGILCHNCNVAIGLLNDEPGRCMAAAEYLSKHSF